MNRTFKGQGQRTRSSKVAQGQGQICIFGHISVDIDHINCKLNTSALIDQGHPRSPKVKGHLWPHFNINDFLNHISTYIVHMTPCCTKLAMVIRGHPRSKSNWLFDNILTFIDYRTPGAQIWWRSRSPTVKAHIDILLYFNMYCSWCAN